MNNSSQLQYLVIIQYKSYVNVDVSMAVFTITTLGYYSRFDKADVHVDVSTNIVLKLQFWVNIQDKTRFMYVLTSV